MDVDDIGASVGVFRGDGVGFIAESGTCSPADIDCSIGTDIASIDFSDSGDVIVIGDVRSDMELGDIRRNSVVDFDK